MTDREMAEEWADKNITLAISMYNPQAESIAKRAFLAGLKAGKDMNVPTKWHKVADGDLPKENKNVLNQSGEITMYESGRGFLGLGGIGVIAWCEIPTFTDKE